MKEDIYYIASKCKAIIKEQIEHSFYKNIDKRIFISPSSKDKDIIGKFTGYILQPSLNFDYLL